MKYWNFKMIAGIFCNACMFFVSAPGISGRMFLIFFSVLVINLIGIVLVTCRAFRIGAWVIMVSSVFFLPIGLIGMYGGRQVLTDRLQAGLSGEKADLPASPGKEYKFGKSIMRLLVAWGCLYLLFYLVSAMADSRYFLSKALPNVMVLAAAWAILIFLHSDLHLAFCPGGVEWHVWPGCGVFIPRHRIRSVTFEGNRVQLVVDLGKKEKKYSFNLKNHFPDQNIRREVAGHFSRFAAQSSHPGH